MLLSEMKQYELLCFEVRGFFSVSPERLILSANIFVLLYREKIYLHSNGQNVSKNTAIHSLIIVIFGVGTSYTLRCLSWNINK